MSQDIAGQEGSQEHMDSEDPATLTNVEISGSQEEMEAPVESSEKENAKESSDGQSQILSNPNSPTDNFEKPVLEPDVAEGVIDSIVSDQNMDSITPMETNKESQSVGEDSLQDMDEERAPQKESEEHSHNQSDAIAEVALEQHVGRENVDTSSNDQGIDCLDDNTESTSLLLDNPMEMGEEPVVPQLSREALSQDMEMEKNEDPIMPHLSAGDSSQDRDEEAAAQQPPTEYDPLEFDKDLRSSSPDKDLSSSAMLDDDESQPSDALETDMDGESQANLVEADAEAGPSTPILGDPLGMDADGESQLSPIVQSLGINEDEPSKSQDAAGLTQFDEVDDNGGTDPSAPDTSDAEMILPDSDILIPGRQSPGNTEVDTQPPIATESTKAAVDMEPESRTVLESSEIEETTEAADDLKEAPDGKDAEPQASNTSHACEMEENADKESGMEENTESDVEAPQLPTSDNPQSIDEHSEPQGTPLNDPLNDDDAVDTSNLLRLPCQSESVINDVPEETADNPLSIDGHPEPEGSPLNDPFNDDDAVDSSSSLQLPSQGESVINTKSDAPEEGNALEDGGTSNSLPSNEALGDQSLMNRSDELPRSSSGVREAFDGFETSSALKVKDDSQLIDGNYLNEQDDADGDPLLIDKDEEQPTVVELQLTNEGLAPSHGEQIGDQLEGENCEKESVQMIYNQEQYDNTEDSIADEDQSEQHVDEHPILVQCETTEDPEDPLWVSGSTDPLLDDPLALTNDLELSNSTDASRKSLRVRQPVSYNEMLTDDAVVEGVTGQKMSTQYKPKGGASSGGGIKSSAFMHYFYNIQTKEIHMHKSGFCVPLDQTEFVTPANIDRLVKLSPFFISKPNQIKRKPLVKEDELPTSDPQMPKGFKVLARKRDTGKHIDRTFFSPDLRYSFRSRRACFEFIKLLELKTWDDQQQLAAKPSNTTRSENYTQAASHKTPQDLKPGTMAPKTNIMSASNIVASVPTTSSVITFLPQVSLPQTSLVSHSLPPPTISMSATNQLVVSSTIAPVTVNGQLAPSSSGNSTAKNLVILKVVSLNPVISEVQGQIKPVAATPLVTSAQTPQPPVAMPLPHTPLAPQASGKASHDPLQSVIDNFLANPQPVLPVRSGQIQTNSSALPEVVLVKARTNLPPTKVSENIQRQTNAPGIPAFVLPSANHISSSTSDGQAQRSITLRIENSMIKEEEKKQLVRYFNIPEVVFFLGKDICLRMIACINGDTPIYAKRTQKNMESFDFRQDSLLRKHAPLSNMAMSFDLFLQLKQFIISNQEYFPDAETRFQSFFQILNQLQPASPISFNQPKFHAFSCLMIYHSTRNQCLETILNIVPIAQTIIHRYRGCLKLISQGNLSETFYLMSCLLQRSKSDQILYIEGVLKFAVSVRNCVSALNLLRTTKFDPLVFQSQLEPGRMSCQRCPSVFNNMWELLEHEAATHVLPSWLNKNGMESMTKSRFCPACGTVQGSPEDMLKHLGSYHNMVWLDPKIVCPFCNKTFPNLIPLKIHLQKHGATVEARPELPTCPFANCKYKVTSFEDFRYHLYSVHYDFTHPLQYFDLPCTSPYILVNEQEKLLKFIADYCHGKASVYSDNKTHKMIEHNIVLQISQCQQPYVRFYGILNPCLDQPQIDWNKEMSYERYTSNSADDDVVIIDRISLHEPTNQVDIAVAPTDENDEPAQQPSGCHAQSGSSILVSSSSRTNQPMSMTLANRSANQLGSLSLQSVSTNGATCQLRVRSDLMGDLQDSQNIMSSASPAHTGGENAPQTGLATEESAASDIAPNTTVSIKELVPQLMIRNHTRPSDAVCRLCSATLSPRKSQYDLQLMMEYHILYVHYCKEIENDIDLMIKSNKTKQAGNACPFAGCPQVFQNRNWLIFHYGSIHMAFLPFNSSESSNVAPCSSPIDSYNNSTQTEDATAGLPLSQNTNGPTGNMSSIAGPSSSLQNANGPTGNMSSIAGPSSLQDANGPSGNMSSIAGPSSSPNTVSPTGNMTSIAGPSSTVNTLARESTNPVSVIKVVQRKDDQQPTLSRNSTSVCPSSSLSLPDNGSTRKAKESYGVFCYLEMSSAYPPKKKYQAPKSKSGLYIYEDVLDKMLTKVVFTPRLLVKYDQIELDLFKEFGISIMSQHKSLVQAHMALKKFVLKANENAFSLTSMGPVRAVMILSQLMSAKNISAEDVSFVILKLNSVHQLLDNGNELIHDKRVVSFLKTIDSKIIPLKPSHCTSCPYKTSSVFQLKLHRKEHLDLVHLKKEMIASSVNSNSDAGTSGNLSSDNMSLSKSGNGNRQSSGRINLNEESLEAATLAPPDVYIVRDTSTRKVNSPMSTKKFQCDKCTFNFHTVKELEDHVAKTHPAARPRSKSRQGAYSGQESLSPDIIVEETTPQPQPEPSIQKDNKSWGTFARLMGRRLAEWRQQYRVNRDHCSKIFQMLNPGGGSGFHADVISRFENWAKDEAAVIPEDLELWNEMLLMARSADDWIEYVIKFGPFNDNPDEVLPQGGTAADAADDNSRKEEGVQTSNETGDTDNFPTTTAEEIDNMSESELRSHIFRLRKHWNSNAHLMVIMINKELNLNENDAIKSWDYVSWEGNQMSYMTTAVKWRLKKMEQHLRNFCKLHTRSTSLPAASGGAASAPRGVGSRDSVRNNSGDRTVDGDVSEDDLELLVLDYDHESQGSRSRGETSRSTDSTRAVISEPPAEHRPFQLQELDLANVDASPQEEAEAFHANLCKIAERLKSLEMKILKSLNKPDFVNEITQLVSQVHLSISINDDIKEYASRFFTKLLNSSIEKTDFADLDDLETRDSLVIVLWAYVMTKDESQSQQNSKYYIISLCRYMAKLMKLKRSETALRPAADVLVDLMKYVYQTLSESTTVTPSAVAFIKKMVPMMFTECVTSRVCDAFQSAENDSRTHLLTILIDAINRYPRSSQPSMPSVESDSKTTPRSQSEASKIRVEDWAFVADQLSTLRKRLLLTEKDLAKELITVFSAPYTLEKLVKMIKRFENEDETLDVENILPSFKKWIQFNKDSQPVNDHGPESNRLGSQLTSSSTAADDLSSDSSSDSSDNENGSCESKKDWEAMRLKAVRRRAYVRVKNMRLNRQPRPRPEPLQDEDDDVSDVDEPASFPELADSSEDWSMESSQSEDEMPKPRLLKQRTWRRILSEEEEEDMQAEPEITDNSAPEASSEDQNVATGRPAEGNSSPPPVPPPPVPPPKFVMTTPGIMKQLVFKTKVNIPNLHLWKDRDFWRSRISNFDEVMSRSTCDSSESPSPSTPDITDRLETAPRLREEKDMTVPKLEEVRPPSSMEEDGVTAEVNKVAAEGIKVAVEEDTTRSGEDICTPEEVKTTSNGHMDQYPPPEGIPYNIVPSITAKESTYHYFCLDCEGCSDPDCKHYGVHPRVPVTLDVASHIQQTGHTNLRKIDGLMNLVTRNYAYHPKYGKRVRLQYKDMILEEQPVVDLYQTPRTCMSFQCQALSADGVEDPPTFTSAFQLFEHIKKKHLPKKRPLPYDTECETKRRKTSEVWLLKEDSGASTPCTSSTSASKDRLRSRTSTSQAPESSEERRTSISSLSEVTTGVSSDQNELIKRPRRSSERPSEGSKSNSRRSSISSKDLKAEGYSEDKYNQHLETLMACHPRLVESTYFLDCELANLLTRAPPDDPVEYPVIDPALPKGWTCRIRNTPAKRVFYFKSPSGWIFKSERAVMKYFEATVGDECSSMELETIRHWARKKETPQK